MKSWSRALAIALLVLTLVVAVLITMAWFSLPLDGITVTVDGQTFSLADLHGPQVAVGLCIAVAAVVIAIVAALVDGRRRHRLRRARPRRSACSPRRPRSPSCCRRSR